MDNISRIEINFSRLFALDGQLACLPLNKQVFQDVENLQTREVANDKFAHSVTFALK